MLQTENSTHVGCQKPRLRAKSAPNWQSRSLKLANVGKQMVDSVQSSAVLAPSSVEVGTVFADIAHDLVESESEFAEFGRACRRCNQKWLDLGRL